MTHENISGQRFSISQQTNMLLPWLILADPVAYAADFDQLQTALQYASTVSITSNITL